MNDSLGDCQSREVTKGKFSAENLARPLVQVTPKQPTLRTEKDIISRNDRWGELELLNLIKT